MAWWEKTVMRPAWLLGCILAGTEVATIFGFLGLLLWAVLNPRKNAELEMGFVVYLLFVPFLGRIVGSLGGSLFAYRYPGLADRAGRVFPWFAVPPLIVSAFFYLTGSWMHSFRNPLAAVFFLSPLVIGVGLLYCRKALRSPP